MNEARLQPLRLESARRALGRYPRVHPEIADAWTQEQLTFDIDGEPFVASLTTDPVLGVADVYIPFIAPPIAESAERIGRVVRHVRETWQQAERVLVRVETPAPSPALEVLDPYILYLSKPAQKQSYSGNQIVWATDAEADFVRWLLVRALLDGYRSWGYEVSSDAAWAYVADNYPAFSPSGPISSLVALKEGRPVAHCTWIRSSRDDVSGFNYAEIVDTFSLQEVAGQGYGRSLLTTLEHDVSKDSGVLLGNVTVERGTDTWQKVYTSLVEAGWTSVYDLLVAP